MCGLVSLAIIIISNITLMSILNFRFLTFPGTSLRRTREKPQRAGRARCGRGAWGVLEWGDVATCDGLDRRCFRHGAVRQERYGDGFWEDLRVCCAQAGDKKRQASLRNLPIQLIDKVHFIEKTCAEKLDSKKLSKRVFHETGLFNGLNGQAYLRNLPILLKREPHAGRGVLGTVSHACNALPPLAS